jgi:hypothetical protein
MAVHSVRSSYLDSAALLIRVNSTASPYKRLKQYSAYLSVFVNDDARVSVLSKVGYRSGRTEYRGAQKERRRYKYPHLPRSASIELD